MCALVAGAAGSVLLMARAGQRQQSRLLILLFTFWVLSPFVALAVANLRAARASMAVRSAIYGAMIGVSGICLSVYGLQAFDPVMKAGTVYLLVPAACWLLLAMASVTAAVASRLK